MFTVLHTERLADTANSFVSHTLPPRFLFLCRYRHCYTRYHAGRHTALGGTVTYHRLVATRVLRHSSLHYERYCRRYAATTTYFASHGDDTRYLFLLMLRIH